MLSRNKAVNHYFINKLRFSGRLLCYLTGMSFQRNEKLTVESKDGGVIMNSILATLTKMVFFSFIIFGFSFKASALVWLADINMDAKVKAGLDAETIVLIDRMPDEIREQTAKLILEAMDRIDVSVFSYLDEVEKIMNRQIVNMICEGKGFVRGTAEALKASLFNESPRPIENLENEYSELISEFKEDTDSEVYLDKYADFLANAAITFCQIKGEPGPEDRISKKQLRARRNFNAWNKAAPCSSATTCLTKSVSLLSNQVASSDPRDVANTDAKKKVIEYGKQPAEKRFWEFWKSFSYRPYEEKMVELLQLSNTIKTNEYKRFDEANEIYKAAKQRVVEIKSALVTTDRIQKKHPFNRHCARNTSGRTTSLLKELDNQYLKLDNAISVSNTITVKSSELRLKIRDAIIATQEVKKRADDMLVATQMPIQLPQGGCPG